MTSRLLALAAIVLFAHPCLLNAQTKERIAITNREDAGPDYWLQGEYEGQVEGQGFVGLQVVAQGLGQFTAVRYQGGLPGTGWNERDKQQYAGVKQGDAVQLRSQSSEVEGVSEIEVTSGRAWLRENGQTVGELLRVHRISPTLDASPAYGAEVLFDSQPHGLKDAEVDDQGLLEVGFSTVDPVQNFRLHVEFRTPFMPNSSGQARGNSGVYIQRRYEVQVLDSFGLEGVENECGGLYRQKRPDVNMCLPPLQWQTYDIYFRAAEFDEAGKKSAPARITVIHNGVPIHNDYAIKAKTGAGRPEGAEPGPILFQNHRDPVRYRNLWLVHVKDQVSPPPTPTPSFQELLCPPVQPWVAFPCPSMPTSGFRCRPRRLFCR